VKFKPTHYRDAAYERVDSARRLYDADKFAEWRQGSTNGIFAPASELGDAAEQRWCVIV
jgi:hypothetical protein